MEIDMIILLVISVLFFIAGLIVLSLSAYLRIENDILRSYLEDDEIETLDEILDLIYFADQEDEEEVCSIPEI